MDILSTIILVVGVPFSLASFILIRKWAKMKDEARPILRASSRAELLRSVPTVIIS
jgi:ABC-type phosphate transport system permease subunit